MNAASAGAIAQRYRTNARNTAPTPDRTDGEASNPGPRPAAWLDDPDDAALSDDNVYEPLNEQPFAYDSGPENELLDTTTAPPHAPLAADIAMDPTWMGDTGFDDAALHRWRAAEAWCGLKESTAKPKHNKTQHAMCMPTLPADISFVPCPTYIASAEN